MRTLSALPLLFVLVGVSDSSAQSDFRDLGAKPGDFVYVTDAQGAVVSGEILHVTVSSLAIAGHTFQPEPGLTIARRGDRFWDGPLAGAAIGSGVGALLSTGECGVDWHAWQCSAAGAAWGALLGALIDYVHHGRKTVFVGTATAGAELTQAGRPRTRRATVSMRLSF